MQHRHTKYTATQAMQEPNTVRNTNKPVAAMSACRCEPSETFAHGPQSTGAKYTPSQAKRHCCKRSDTPQSTHLSCLTCERVGEPLWQSQPRIEMRFDFLTSSLVLLHQPTRDALGAINEVVERGMDHVGRLVHDRLASVKESSLGTRMHCVMGLGVPRSKK